jgi:tetratricopeptide (TPR) repeat protein
MKPVALAVPASRPPVPEAPLLERVKPAPRLHELRRVRDRLSREGKLDLALQTAGDLARRDPGRESYLHWGRLLRETGRLKDALRVLRDALRFESGPAYLVPEIHLQMAATWSVVGKHHRAGESLRRAYAARPKARADHKVHMVLGNFHFGKNRWAEAAAEYERAEAAACSPRERALAMINRGLAWHRAGRLERAVAPVAKAQSTLSRMDCPGEAAVARTVLASIHLDRRNYGRSLEMGSRAMETYRLLGNEPREAESANNSAHAAIEGDRPERAHPILKRCLHLASRLGRTDLLATGFSMMALLEGHHDDFDAAGESLRKAESLLRGRRDPTATLHVCRARARIAAMLGSWEEMSRWARRAERLAAKLGDQPRLIEFRKLRSEAEVRLGHRKAAVQVRNAARRLESIPLKARGCMADLSRLARRLASSRLPVLIVGAAGTGKTELAKQVHRVSPRSRGPLEIAGCEGLVFAASELAGHAKGAWSGADKEASGYFRRADRGTLVLDRVDEIDAKSQRILLRMIDGEVRPVGSAEAGKVDVRVVATCRRPERLIPELRHRLAGAVLQVPDLARRGDEFPMLVEQMLAGRRRITIDAVAELARQAWPGNLPELQAVVERLVAASEDVVGLNLVRRTLDGRESRQASLDRARRRRIARMAEALA